MSHISTDITGFIVHNVKVMANGHLEVTGLDGGGVCHTLDDKDGEVFRTNNHGTQHFWVKLDPNQPSITTDPSNDLYKMRLDEWFVKDKWSP